MTKLFKVLLIASMLLTASVGHAVQQGGAGNATPEIGIPAGVIYAYGGTSAPSGFVLCDGSSLLRAGAYAYLYAAIGDAWGTADGTHFNVPDLRGRFLRGHDNGAGRDPDAASRTASNTGGETGDKVGTVQAEALKAHLHPLNTEINGTDSGTGYIQRGYTGTLSITNTNSSSGSETRPVNACVNYIIKY